MKNTKKVISSVLLSGMLLSTSSALANDSTVVTTENTNTTVETSELQTWVIQFKDTLKKVNIWIEKKEKKYNLDYSNAKKDLVKISFRADNVQVEDDLKTLYWEANKLFIPIYKTVRSLEWENQNQINKTKINVFKQEQTTLIHKIKSTIDWVKEESEKENKNFSREVSQLEIILEKANNSKKLEDLKLLQQDLDYIYKAVTGHEIKRNQAQNKVNKSYTKKEYRTNSSFEKQKINITNNIKSFKKWVSEEWNKQNKNFSAEINKLNIMSEKLKWSNSYDDLKSIKADLIAIYENVSWKKINKQKTKNYNKKVENKQVILSKKIEYLKNNIKSTIEYFESQDRDLVNEIAKLNDLYEKTDKVNNDNNLKSIYQELWTIQDSIK